jgi:hypothetical protein
MQKRRGLKGMCLLDVAYLTCEQRYAHMSTGDIITAFFHCVLP